MASPPYSAEEVSSLTDTQEKILSLLPILPSAASALCSGTIIYLVILSRFESSYKRILFAISVADIITSVSFSFQPFLLPKATSQRVWAIGNDATCTVLGTFSQLSMTSIWYTGMLSYYYLLTIRFGVKEAAFARRIEPWMHALATGWPLLTGLAGAVMGIYHEIELGQGCYITDWPEGCADDTGECKSPLIAWMFGGIWVVVMILSIVVNNVVIYRTVRNLLRLGMARSMNRNTQSKRIKEVATQATLYIAAFLGTFIWTVVLRIMESLRFDSEDEAQLFPLLVIQNIMVPSTGVLNLIIYLRPRYKQIRAAHSQASSIWVFRRALYGERVREPMDTQESANNSNFRSLISAPSEKFQGLVVKMKSSMSSGRNNISSMTRVTWQSEDILTRSMQLDDDLAVDKIDEEISLHDLSSEMSMKPELAVKLDNLPRISSTGTQSKHIGELDHEAVGKIEESWHGEKDDATPPTTKDNRSGIRLTI